MFGQERDAGYQKGIISLTQEMVSFYIKFPCRIITRLKLWLKHKIAVRYRTIKTWRNAKKKTNTNEKQNMQDLLLYQNMILEHTTKQIKK